MPKLSMGTPSVVLTNEEYHRLRAFVRWMGNHEVSGHPEEYELWKPADDVLDDVDELLRELEG